MNREYGDYIQDIFNSIKETEEFTEGMNFEKFTKDKKTVNAVIRSLEVMGEASKKIPDVIRTKSPEIPWKLMAGIRDKMIHEYHGVDLSIVCQVVKNELPPLKPHVLKLLRGQDAKS